MKEKLQKQNNSEENIQSYNWIKENSWVVALIISVIVFVLSLGWMIRDRDFEPAIALLSSLVTFFVILINKGIKGFIFIVGFLLGIVLTISLFYFFSPSKIENTQKGQIEINKPEKDNEVSNQKNIEANNSTIETSSNKNNLSPSTRKLPDGRIVINISPEFLDNISIQNTDIQARKMLEIYVGKWIELSGKVANVKNIRKNNSFIILEKTERDINSTLIFFTNEKEIERIQTLKRGDQVKVLGQINLSDVSTGIYLDNCEIID